MAKPDYLRSEIAKYTVGIASDFDAIPTRYLRLYYVLPNPNGTGGIEVNDGGYSPVNLATCVPMETDGIAVNTAEINFGIMEENSTGDVHGCAIWDAPTGGNLIGLFPFLGVEYLAKSQPISDNFQAVGTSFSEGEKVLILQLDSLPIPAELTDGLSYYVKDVDGINFKLSLTENGLSFPVATEGVFRVQSDYRVPFLAGDVARVKAGDFAIIE